MRGSSWLATGLAGLAVVGVVAGVQQLRPVDSVSTQTEAGSPVAVSPATAKAKNPKAKVGTWALDTVPEGYDLVETNVLALPDGGEAKIVGFAPQSTLPDGTSSDKPAPYITVSVTRQTADKNAKTIVKTSQREGGAKKVKTKLGDAASFAANDQWSSLVIAAGDDLITVSGTELTEAEALAIVEGMNPA